MTPLRCYGNIDFDKTHFIIKFDLFVETLWQSISRYMFFKWCNSCSNLEGIITEKSNRATLIAESVRIFKLEVLWFRSFYPINIHAKFSKNERVKLIYTDSFCPIT